MDLHEVAGELYAAAPADFIAQRNAAASGADGDLSKAIRALRKPSAAAAAVNALVRGEPGLIDDILDVGDRMRDAFARRDRDAIRQLTQERQGLIQRATSGVEVSPSVRREVEETLQAAVIDPAAAAAVRSGMLIRALASTGVESVDVDDAVALPVDVSARPVRAAPRPEKTPAEPVESAAQRRERERRVRAAEKALQRARDDAEAIDDELDAVVDRRSDLEAEREELDRRVQHVMDELTESRRAERELRKRITTAHTAIRDAEKALRQTRDE